jgi:hypothetical protein
LVRSGEGERGAVVCLWTEGRVGLVKAEEDFMAEMHSGIKSIVHLK